MSIDHDQTFKTLITEFFREFMELFLEEQAALIDFSSVRFMDKEITTDLPKGSRKQLDLVVDVKLKAGGEEFVLVHTEFQASRGGPDFPRRMYQYYCQLFLRHGKPVIPVALFSDDAIWRKRVPDTYEVRVGSEVYSQFRYHLIKLKDFDARAFLKSENPLAFALMAKMDYSRQEQVRLKAEFLRLIMTAKVNEARRSLLLEFVDGYMPLEDAEQKELVRFVKTQPDYEEVTKMITSFERVGIEKGIEKGIERGIERGVIEARHEVFIELLREKFGFVNAITESQVGAINSVAKLDALLKAIIHAESIEDLDI